MSNMLQHFSLNNRCCSIKDENKTTHAYTIILNIIDMIYNYEYHTYDVFDSHVILLLELHSGYPRTVLDDETHFFR